MPAGRKGPIAVSRPRRPRGSLTPEQILAAAENLVEEDGLDALTMPAIGRRMGVATTSIYWHFRSRDELLVALTEMVTAKIHERLPGVDGSRPWAEEAYAYFTALHHELMRHPAYLTLFSTRARFLFSRADLGSSVLRRLEQEVTLFIQAGFTPVEAAHAYTTCSTYVRGFSMLEYGLTHEAIDDDEPSISAAVSKLDPAVFPTLSRLADFEQTFWLDDAQFDLGLRLVLTGIEQGLAPHR